MNYTGLYTPFKLNRPLTVEEKNNQLRQDFSAMDDNEALALDDGVVIKMNSTYLEIVDKYYMDRGMPDIFLFVLFFIFSLLAISIAVLLFFNPTNIPTDMYWIIGSFIMIIMSSIVGLLFGKLLRKSWFTWTHYPIRFNRKTKMVHVFKLDGSVLSAAWQDIFFTRNKAGQGAMPEWSIDGHILAADRETVIDTFSLGFSTMRRGLLANWAFVRSYMEVDNCLPELADIIALCPPIAEQKESYQFGLQYLMRMGSRLEWLQELIIFPLKLLGSVARFIAMRTSKLPRWPSEVEAQCQVAADDPINVSAANNPKHLWRYVLANQSMEEYQALYQRQERAMVRLREKVKQEKFISSQ